MVNRSRVHLWDEVSNFVTLARPGLDSLAGPIPETPTDRAVRERLRAAFPTVDFDHRRAETPLR